MCPGISTSSAALLVGGNAKREEANETAEL